MRTIVALMLGWGLTVALLWALGGPYAPAAAAGALGRAQAAPAGGGVITVCLGGSCDYASVQAAVDAAAEGDEIRVATGVYTGVEARAGVTQVVYVDKSLTVRGGYTTTDWSASRPATYPTTLDAQGEGRVLYLTGTASVVIEGLRIAGGDAQGLGGGPAKEVDDAGGGVYFAAATAVVSSSEIVSNAAGFGGGLYLYNGSAAVHGCKIAGNSASQKGGALYVWRSDAVLTGNAVTGNDALEGGGLYLYQADAVVRDNVVSDNSADNGGGGYLFGGSSTLEGNAIGENAASYGGGLYLYSNVGSLSDNAVGGNEAGTSGGGLYVMLGAPRLTGNTITGSRAGWGGGIYLRQSGATLETNTVVSNAATWKGGGIRLVGGAARLAGNTVSHNTALRGAGVQAEESEALIVANLISENAASDGGGLYLFNSSDHVTANTVLTNTSNGFGGGLWVETSEATVEENRFSGNSAQYGGGVYLLESGTAVLRGNAITGNVAEYRGGGAYLDQSDAMLEANSFRGNEAGRYGGGLYVYEGAPGLSRNEVVGNVGANGGGGLYLHQTDALMVNTLVAHNGAETSGSGVTVLTGEPRALHTTLVKNEPLGNGASENGDGSGIYVAAGHFALTNTILVSHTLGVHVAEGDGVAALESTLWGADGWANEIDWNGAGTVVTGTPANNLWVDPMFTAPEAGDYHVAWGSAAVDRGVDAGVNDDIDGGPRPVPASGAPDLGADEHNGVWLSPSRKRVAPVRADPGEVVTYTVVLLNEGTMPSPGSALFDPLPAGTTYVTGSASAGTLDDTAGIRWTGTLTPFQPVTVTYRVTVSLATPIRNLATITDAYGIPVVRGVWLNGFELYVPLLP